MRARIGVATVIILLAAGVVSAEPIQITSGLTSLYWDASLSSFELQGTNSEFIGEFHVAPSVAAFRGGSVLNLSAMIPATNAGNHPLRQILDGVTYSAWLNGGLSLVVAPFVAPQTSETGPSVTFNLPFTMTGHINAYSQRDLFGNLSGPLFSTDVSGSGTTSIGFRASMDDTFVLPFVGGQSFKFSSADPAPTPEPGTMLLVATGVILVVRRRFRR